MGPNTLYCGKWRKISKSRHDLDLGLTMPSIEVVRVIFIYYNVFKVQVPRSISLSYRANTHTPTDAHKDTDEYFIVIFCKKRNYTYYIYVKVAFDGSHLHDIKAISPVSLPKTRGIPEKQP